MDSYLAPGETCHPSDNFGAVLAASESVGGTGKELLTAFAVAYQVQSRLSDEAPVRARGFDHTVQGAYAAAASAAKALRLPADRIANAIAISGTANNALRVTRTGNLSHWKGLAYPQVAKEGTFAALLARAGITGPEQVFEGNKGFHDSIAGDFSIDWAGEDLERVRRSIIKKHNAEIHSQSALDAAQDVRAQDGFNADAITKVRLRTFDVAYSIIGGGEEGDKRTIRTKEEADHSLPWMLAVVLLDGELTPRQYHHERIVEDDVQDLLQKVTIIPDDEFSARFPETMPADLEVTLADGTVFRSAQDSYEGFHTDPLTWAGARAKFDSLVTDFTTPELREQIAEVVRTFEEHDVSDLTGLLAQESPTRN
jgi:2-methylcitrate dehydratase